MASKKTQTARPLIALIVAVLLGVVTLTIGHFTQGAGFVPKMALDLEGGTQLILTPKLQEGAEGREVSQDDMNEAIKIIRQRIDASGVAEAEISTLGTNNIVVAIPGEADEDILNLVRSSATMRFRPVLQAVSSPAALDPTQLQSSAQSDDAQSGEVIDWAAMTPEEAATLLADFDEDGTISSEPSETPENNSDLAWITEQVYYDYLLLDCTDPASLTQDELDDSAAPLAACDVDQLSKYILGPVDVEGTHLSQAVAGAQMTTTGNPTGLYAVNLTFDDEGTKAFSEASTRLYEFLETDTTRNRFGVVLDGNVIVAPSMNSPILTGQAEITGDFTAAEAQALANQLQFGSLPLNFEVQSEQQISATLGSNHLEKGLWAGLIGLILVIIFMVWQYRGLSILSAGSLLVAAFITYLTITLLSWTMGYRLSLPGVAGLIVAVGITADSFIVYFERIRDEVREGRPLQAAVEDGWARAKRTILISDAVNLIAAIVLYVLAVGGVQGFAFTLGVTTVVDLLVVFAFTHPVLSMLIKTKFFGGGHKLSGLDPEHLGARSVITYQGRGRVAVRGAKPAEDDNKVLVSAGSSVRVEKETSRVAKQVGTAPAAAVPVEEAPSLSLAERRRLARLQAEDEEREPGEADVTEESEAKRG